ncbi:MAG: hypothetical protein AAB465_03480, partial [Patescibacteria group bacterium]
MRRKNQWTVRDIETNKVSYFNVGSNVSKKSDSKLKNFIRGSLTVLTSVLIIVAVAKAAPPTSPYNPGETLTPSCAPEDDNCTVIAPAISTRIINTTAPLLGGGSLSADRTFSLAGLTGLGTANQLLGMNNGATVYEYKTLNGTTNQVIIAHAANSITLSAPQNIHVAATPTFAGLTLTAFSGYVKATAGVLSAGSIAAGDLPTAIDATKIADGSISNMEFQYLNGVTSAIQTQLGNKQASDAALTSISGLTYVSPSFIKLTADDTYAVRTIAETKTDLSLNNVENTALSTWAGTTNITTLGTIGTGTWNATAIADGKIASALTGKTYNALTLTALTTGFTIIGGTTSKTLTLDTDLTASAIPEANIADGTIFPRLAATENITGAWTFDTNVLTINPVDDRVGIGQTTPSSKLDVTTTA